MSKSFYVKIKLKKIKERKKKKNSLLDGSEGSKDELKEDETTEETDSFYCWPAPRSLAGLHPEFLPALGLFGLRL